MSNYDKAEPFNDPRNITVKGIRIIWATSARPYATGVWLGEGWVLPGGTRVISEDKVRDYIDQLLEATAPVRTVTKA